MDHEHVKNPIFFAFNPHPLKPKMKTFKNRKKKSLEKVQNDDACNPKKTRKVG